MSQVRTTVRRLPVDVIWILASIAIVFGATGFASGSPVRLAVALVFLLFVPGYALTTAVAPGEVTSAGRQAGQPLAPAPGAALDTAERMVVSFGLSLVLLPLFGLALTVLSWPLTPRWILIVSSTFVIVMTLVGAARRLRMAEDARYAPAASRWFARSASAFHRSSSFDAVLHLILTLAVVFAAGSLAVAIAGPQHGGTYSEMSLLTTTERGELVAANYPTAFTQGEGEPLVLEVTNHENQPVDYTVIVVLERVQGEHTTETTELEWFEKRIPAEGTWQIRHTVTPTMTGDDLRLTYLLYAGEPPEEPHVSNAYRHVYLWIDVSG